MLERLDRATLEQLLADYATGVLDANTERRVQDSLVDFPDLAAQAEALKTVRGSLSRASYNAVVDARAMRAVQRLRPTPRRTTSIWIGATAFAAAAAAVYVFMFVPDRGEQNSVASADAEYEHQSQIIDELYAMIAQEADDAKIDALVGDGGNDQLLFFTEDDVQYLLSDDHDS